jgi:ribosomal protein S18 acetylase RimI-like enzyme
MRHAELDRDFGRGSAPAPASRLAISPRSARSYHRHMGSITVRQACVKDAKAMARVHVQSWQETYRGLMADEILDRPGFVERRERFWAAALGDERYSANRVAVAERGGEPVGIAMAGPAEDPDAHWPVQLFVLYVLAADHGRGAGHGLLAAVIGNDQAALWVADPNPRAQAFYRKHGFRPDGARKHDRDRDLDEIRMVRHAADPPSRTRARISNDW